MAAIGAAALARLTARGVGAGRARLLRPDEQTVAAHGSRPEASIETNLIA
jgi:NAD(P)H-hydrate repair Nnr-like enzyme with NAD(P)H-hydrate dehydratase domain